MSLKNWEINGLSLELDLEDVDTLERYEDAFAEMASEENSIPKVGKKSEQIRAYCNLFKKLYDKIFGDGTSNKIFKDIPVNAARYDEIYISFLEFVKSQTTESNEKRKSSIQKYITKNRKQKRSQK